MDAFDNYPKFNPEFSPFFDFTPELRAIKENYIANVQRALDNMKEKNYEILLRGYSDEEYEMLLDEHEAEFDEELAIALEIFADDMEYYYLRHDGDFYHEDSRPGFFTRAAAWFGGYKLFHNLFG